MGKDRKNEKGMVLLIVLLVVTLLMTLLVEFSFSTLVDLRLAETFRDTVRAEQLAKGGIRVGRMILQDDNNSYDGPNEDWAQGIEQYPVADGTVSIRATDLGGRFDLNRLVTPQGNIDPLFKDRYLALLDLLGADDPVVLTDSLIDWLDPDDLSEPNGAEERYYRSLETPYNCNNRALSSLEELVLIRGYNRKLISLLRPHVTVFGSAKVNVNSASSELLQALVPQMDAVAAETIIEARRQEPFTRLEELKELPGMESLYGFVYLYLDVKSSSYRIESTASVNDGHRTIVATVDKNGDRTLYTRVL
ncbi:MAG: hypothetical protein C0615_03365 [Desulfuromonas sp.]|nr:MAG: hypothetical protein C0615_03365 [Desulfuromonas sp.]